MNRLPAICVFLVLAWLSAADALAVDKAKLRWMHGRPPIRKIIIEGNSSIKTSSIRDKMYSRERGILHWLKGERRSKVQRETLRRDTLEIKYLYLKNGFLNVRVSERFEMTEIDSAAIVRVTIEEGRQYSFGEKSLVGEYPKAYDLHFDKLVRRLKTGKPVDPFLLNEAIYEMKTYMANRGYPYARIEHTIDTVNCVGGCPVTFRIVADSVVSFGKVTVTGAKSFPKSVATRELKIREGATYRRDDILDSQRRLHESGCYTSFTLKQTEDTLNRLRPDFVLNVRERKPHYITTSTGPVGQSEVKDLLWSFTFGFGKRNLLGSRRLNLSADYFFSVGTDSRLRRHLYSLKLTEPRLPKLHMPFIFGVEYHPKIKSESVEEYDIQTVALKLSTRKNYSRVIRTELGLELEWVDIDGIPEDLIPIIKQRDTTTVRRKLYFDFRRDSRDHLFIPSQGSVGDLSFQYVGGFLGGDDNFVKIEAGWSRYEVVWPGWIAAMRIRGGWIDQFGVSEFIPTEDRFYLGGANTIRSFKEKSLGPVDPLAGSAIGAKYLILFNQEFRWKTVQVLQKLPGVGKLFTNLPLWQSVFFDAGNGFESLEEIKFDALAYSYGTGLQIVSPAGPIRVDYARRIKTNKYDFDYRWHFTILYAF